MHYGVTGGKTSLIYFLKLCFKGSMGMLHNSLSLRNVCFMFSTPLGTKLLSHFTNVSGSIICFYNLRNSHM